MLFRLTPAIRSLCSIKSLQRQLGHRSATLTLDRYGHLFPDELDTLSTVLEDLRSVPPTDFSRTSGAAAEVIALSDRL